MQELISAKFALDNLFLKPNTVFLDATFHLPNSGRNALDEFNNKHIPNARFFDIDQISDKKSSLPHMLPDEEYFSKMVSSLGIKNDDTVIVYDNSIFFSSARAWWMFKIFGHEIFLLNCLYRINHHIVEQVLYYEIYDQFYWYLA